MIKDKIKMANALDDLGIDYIEGGWPGSNPTDDSFFNSSLNLKKFQSSCFWHD